ncbi:MAG: T9SS type A sorting domain-containing protein [Bacteroidetes bacterium]|nr:T9SS type A sorting domain-containing protein [Bacteroidota bacterium]
MTKVIYSALISVLSFFVFKASSQTYAPFVVDSVAWKERYSQQEDFGTSVSQNFNFILGDTIIDTFNYAKVYTSKVLYESNYAPIGFLREEHKKVYAILPQFMPIEFLLYDFSLNVGDSMLLCNNLGFPSFISTTLLSIDSIEIEDGTYRKRFNYDLPSQIVEGIGNIGPYNSGLFTTNGQMGVDSGNSLDCYFTPNKTIYRSTYYQLVDTLDCFTITGIRKEPTEKIDLKVYPNPSSTTFIFELADFENTYNMEIQNIFGQVMINERISAQISSIDVANWSEGFYYILLRDMNGILLGNEKVIISH